MIQARQRVHRHLIAIAIVRVQLDGVNRRSATVQLRQRTDLVGLQVVGIDVLENAKSAAKFHDGHHLTYPAVVDSGVLRDQYNINGLPVHVFIDRGGIVRNIVVGELSPADMDENVQRIIR